MFNNYHKQTKSDKLVINKETKLPVYERSIFSRLSAIKRELGISNKPTVLTHDQRWNNICNHVNILSL